MTGAIENSCPIRCPTGQFYNSDKNLCSDCYYKCATCTSNCKSKCTSCRGNHMLLAGKCYSECPDGFLNNEKKNKCDICTSNQCPPCDNPTDVVYKGRCSSKCPSRTFRSGSHCLDCPYGCLICTSKINCKKCENEGETPEKNTSRCRTDRYYTKLKHHHLGMRGFLIIFSCFCAIILCLFLICKIFITRQTVLSRRQRQEIKYRRNR